MKEWVVYSRNGEIERCRLKSIEYNGVFMNERAVTATFKTPVKVDFEIFDYIEYRGERFELETEPTVKKVSSFSYEYELRFVSYKYELERCEMRDIVPNDNDSVYPTPLSFSFTGDVRYLTERIKANLDALYGIGVWDIVVMDGTESEEKNITIAQQNCWNALSLVNTSYGLNFQIKGRVISVGGDQAVVSHVFQYGKGNGLYEIERVADTDTAIITKLRAFGSNRNLDYSYLKRPEWVDSALGTSFVLSPLRLMLPSFKEDGKTDFVLADEATITEYGVREASIVYDDIYPSITGATNASGEAIDEIQSVEPITDEDAPTFVVYLRDLGFDLEEHLTTSNAQISMKTGAMQGYTFTMTKIERLANGSYKITLGRITTDESDTGNYDIPNKDWNMKAGDKFVLLNILMPQEYIREAEQRLLARAQKYIAEYGKTNFSYNIGLHDKFLVDNPSVYEDLIEGAKLEVYDAELGFEECITIQSITISENVEENVLPQVKVTLNNKPSASTLDRIQGQIKELSDSTSGNFSSQSELLQQYRKKLDKPFFDRLFAAVDENGDEIPSTDLATPIKYIKARSSFVTTGGLTSYVSDKFELPTIAEELPYDKKTIWLNPETGKIEVIGGTGGGGGTLTKEEIIGMGFNLGSEDIGDVIEDVDEEYATKGYVNEAISNIGGGGGIDKIEPLVIKDSNGVEKVVFDGSEEKTVILTKHLVGLSNVNNTEDSEKSVKYAESAGYSKSLKRNNNSYAGTVTSGSEETHYFGRHGVNTDLRGSRLKFWLGTNPSVGELEMILKDDGELLVSKSIAVGRTVGENTTPRATLDVEGDAMVTGGLHVGGVKLCELEDGVLMIDGHLVVTNGLTTYANDETSVPNELLQSLVERISALESEVERLKNG